MTTDLMKIIRRPVVTEKSTLLKEASNQVVFEVSRKASKPAIKLAVEKAFNVKVENVNTLVVRGKVKAMGRHVGKRPNWKKAIVTLKEGHSIEMAEGV